MGFADMLNDYPPVLDVKDIQQILRIGRAAAYKLMNDPSFGAVKVGGSLRITKTKLIQYLERTEAV